MHFLHLFLYSVFFFSHATFFLPPGGADHLGESHLWPQRIEIRPPGVLQESGREAGAAPGESADFACYLLYISHIILQIFYDIFRLGLELKISNEIHLLSDFLST